MKTAIRIALWILRRIVKLYPRPFHTQFADEMEAVFAARLTTARRDGPVALIAASLHEGCGLLVGLIYEHSLAWSKRQGNTHRGMASSLVLACFGVALFLRRGIVSYFCNIADADGGGTVNRVACGLYFQDPGGRVWTIIGVIALVPLLWEILAYTLRRRAYPSDH